MITAIVKVSPDDASLEEKLRPASSIIKSGGLVVFPTETVYGLGADGTNSTATDKIYKAKGRPSDNPLIIHVEKPEDAEKYAYTNEIYYKIAENFMPGAITVILEARPIIPLKTRASLPTVAIRCPENYIARTLIRLSGVPIAAPSANLSGSPSPTRAEHVIADMSGRVDMIIDGGECEFGLESTIIKIENDGGVVLLRPGKITADDILPLVKYVKIAASVTEELKVGEIALSPGMKYRHYAPKAPLFLLDCDMDSTVEYLSRVSNNGKRIAIIAYNDDLELLKNIKGISVFSFGARADELTQAHLLFDLLRQIDIEGFEEIYAPLPKKEGIGLALYNRMIRASAHHIIRM